MTDKTALLALADELAAAWNTAKEFDMDEFADRIRALAEQPAGAVGSAPSSVWSEPEMYAVLVDSLRASKGWTTAYAEAFVDDFQSVTAPPAASVDVGWVEFLEEWIGDGCLGSFEHREKFRKAARALIDSAGGAKGYCARCDNNREVLANETDASDASTTPCPDCAPQPDGGDGAVFGYVYQLADEEPSFEFAADRWPSRGGNHTETAVYTRPSAAAAVPEGWEIVVEGDAVRVTRPGGVVSEWTSRPNTNGSGMYDLCRALAQQEPRHE